MINHPVELPIDQSTADEIKKLSAGDIFHTPQYLIDHAKSMGIELAEYYIFNGLTKEKVVWEPVSNT